MLKILDLLKISQGLLLLLFLKQITNHQLGNYSLLLYFLDLIILYNMIFKRSGMSILLGTDGANNLFVLFDMAHVLALAIAMYLLYVLVKVILLVERGRALFALPRLRNYRFLKFLLLWRNIIIVLIFVFFSFFLFLIFL
jgi:hypothetical protein